MTTNKFRLTGSDVFGRYCRIEMQRFGVPNEFYVHKCIKSYRSNYSRDVPIKSVEGEYLHPGKCVDVVNVITCGVEERDVFAVPLDSVEFIEPEEEGTCCDVSDDGDFFTCSRCGCAVRLRSAEADAFENVTYGPTLTMPNGRGEKLSFCPHCGARVTSGGEC